MTRRFLLPLALAWFGLLPAARAAEALPPPPPGRLIGPVEGAILSPGVRVCPGAPVVLNATWVSDGTAPLDRNLTLDFEVAQGAGWFEAYGDLKPKLAGWFDLWKGKLKGWRQGRRFQAQLSAGDLSTAVVFHPLGPEGSEAVVKVTCDIPTSAPLEYRLTLGKDRSGEFAKAVAKGLANEQAMDNVRFTYDENISVKSLLRSGKWTSGRVYRMERILENGYVVSKNKDDDKPRTDPREPYDAGGSPYRLSVFWGMEGDSFIGCMLDPGDAGGLMLYNFDPQGGQMRGFRGFGPHLCSWGLFTWVPGLKGSQFMIEVKKKLWSPPGRLTEDTAVVRTEPRELP